MAAGDSILLCKGGSFTSSGVRLANYKCSADKPCTIGSYRSDGPAPIINATANGLNFQDGGNADHDEGYVVKDLNLVGSGTGFGIFLFNDVDHVTVDGVTIESFNIGMYSAGANPPNPGANRINEFVVLKNSVIKNNPGSGWLGGGNGITIENNKFHNNGSGKKIFNHNVYASNGKDWVIKGNDIYQSTMVEGRCQGTSLVIHGVVEDLLIENNNIREDVGASAQTCWGIAVDPGYAAEESFSRVVIKGNTVANVGNMGIGCASCTDVWIVDNKIIHEQNFGFTAISVPNRKEDTVKSDRVLVADNDIVLTGPKKTGVKLPAVGLSRQYNNNVH